MTRYEFRVVCHCPVDDGVDCYDVTVEHPEMIPVEMILEVSTEATREPSFQEDVTRRIARGLAGATVTTVGYHSGVKTTCSCS